MGAKVFKHHGALNDEALIREAHRIALVHRRDIPDAASVLVELSERLTTLIGFRRGYFDAVAEEPE